ncbi:MAG: HEAT repeat domain-containing protein [Bryobacterales bacterium]|nr:HEAT repeat domain-containing protein [Bryobacterales bacterium]
MLTCEQARERLAERWVDGIDEPRRMELDAHLAGCSDCREQAEELDSLWHAMALMPEEEPSRRMRANFEHMLDAYRAGGGASSRTGIVQTQIAPGSTAHLPRWWDGLAALWPRQPLVQFAIAGAALIFGLVSGHLYTARQQDQQTIAQLRGEMNSMRQLVALSLLQQQSASDRLKGVTYSVRMEPAGDEVLNALLDTLREDGNVNVRLAAVDALRQFSARQTVRRGLRDAIANQDSPLVQVALIDWAMESRDGGSLPALRQLAGRADLNPSVRPQLERAIGLIERH